ncbi:HlyD family secretion protein [Candidatus Omnitrophota bacterium]
MKGRGIMGILLLGLLLMSTIACSGGEETTSQQPADGGSGDINVTVSGDGNIEASSRDRLTFGSSGKVDKIFVKEGDKVNKGDVLARLDTGDTGALELAEAQAQVALTQAQLALTKAQLALTGQELAVSQAEINVKNAEIALERTEDSWLDTKYQGKKVKQYREYLEYYLEEYPEDTKKISDVRKSLQYYWGRFLTVASDSADSKEVTAKEMKLELAKESVEHAQQNLNLEKQNINLAEQNVNLAQKSLDQARKDLEEEAATIIAPFNGMVSRVGAKEGEFLSPAAYTGTTIVELIDPRHMELTARVDELDVVKVKTGQKVMISIDATPGMTLDGLVTFISPVAREPVDVLFEDFDEEKEYEVKIDFNTPENSPIRIGMNATAEIFVE